MTRVFAGFDWDTGNRQKCQKHGVSLLQIEMVFSGTPRVAPDPRHSALEERHIAIGRTASGRGIFVAFAYRMVRGSLMIRPVSARYMHKKEIDAYEKKSTEV